MLGRMLGMQTAFLIAAVTILAIAAAFVVGLREPGSKAPSAEATFRSLAAAAWEATRGAVPGMRAVFVATFLVQLTFQTFTTWFALHSTERFGIRPEDATVGFIAWALGGIIGALPAGAIGVRIGRRNAMLLGFALMAVCLLALDRVTSVSAWRRRCLRSRRRRGRSRWSTPIRCSSSRFHRSAAASSPRSSCCRWRSAAPSAIR